MVKVNTDRMSDQARRMKELAKDLNKVSSSLADVNRSLRWRNNIEYRVRSNLSTLSNSVSSLDNKAENLAQTIERIIALYQKAESEILSDGNERDNGSSSGGSEGGGEDAGPASLEDFFWDSIIPNILPFVIVGPGGMLPALLLSTFDLITDPDTHFGYNPSRTPGSSSYGDWLGYEFSEDNPGVSAWIGKGGKSAQNEYAYGEVNGYIGKVDASIKGDGGFMERVTKTTYKDGEWVTKEEYQLVYGEIGGGVDVAVIGGDASGSLGNDLLGVEGGIEGSAGNAELKGKLEFGVGEDGVNALASGSALVSAVEGEAKGSINILGIEITGKVGGYAGAVGVKGKIGFENGKFVAEGGAAALLGLSGGVEIGFNETGWDNFVDTVTFWD